MASYNTQQLQDIDGQHHIHPFTDHKALMEKGTRIITRADGVYLWDSDGNKILDGMAGLWCVNVGYGRQELVDAATDQMQELPYYNNFFQTTHPPAIELSKALVDISPSQFNHVFFTNSGSEANDTVVRMVRHFWALEGKPEKTVIISRENAYHGSTVAGSSLGGMKGMHAQGGILHDIEHIAQPYWYRSGSEMDPEEFGLKTAQALEIRIKEIGEDRVAAFIAEPVQGAGGVIVPQEDYFKRIREICDQYEVLLVADEVITGFGRTGKMFGLEHWGIEPDLMQFAKAITSGYFPLGGIGISDEIASVMNDSGSPWMHAYTYSSHPVGCAVALAMMDIVENEDFVGQAQTKGKHLLVKLKEALADHPHVGEVRGLGMMCGVELVKDKATKEMFDASDGIGAKVHAETVKRGMFSRVRGDCYCVAPPIVTSESTIDDIASILGDSVEAALG